VRRRVRNDQPGLYLESGRCLIGLESSDDVVLEILDDRANFGVNWTIWNSGRRRCRYRWSRDQKRGVWRTGNGRTGRINCWRGRMQAGCMKNKARSIVNIGNREGIMSTMVWELN
jgi:hypothetical protein